MENETVQQAVKAEGAFRRAERRKLIERVCRLAKQGLSVTEIAARLRRSHGSIAGILERARVMPQRGGRSLPLGTPA